MQCLCKHKKIVDHWRASESITIPISGSSFLLYCLFVIWLWAVLMGIHISWYLGSKKAYTSDPLVQFTKVGLCFRLFQVVS